MSDGTENRPVAKETPSRPYVKSRPILPSDLKYPGLKEAALVRENDAAANLFERLLTVVDGIDCLACRRQDGEHERSCVVPWVRVWLATHADQEDA